MEISKIILDIIDKHPGLAIIYISVFTFSSYLTIYIIKYYLPFLSSNKTEDIRVIRKQLEDIYREVLETKGNNRDLNKTLTDIRIKLELILEKLRGKGL